MLFCDLLRISVLLVAAVATALGGVSVLVANRDVDELVLTVAIGWWIAAAAIGVWLGRPSRAADAISRLLAGARTATSLPSETPGRIAFMRLWPIGGFAVLVGGAGWFAPQISAIGAGYAILIALAWRGREQAVSAIEDRDGVRFYVEPSAAFEPVKLIRTPGLHRDRAPIPKPPPPSVDPGWGTGSGELPGDADATVADRAQGAELRIAAA